MKAFEEIQGRVREAVSRAVPEEFIYDLLRAYGLPKAAVTRLETGAYNLAKKPGEILWKKRLFFAVADNGRLRTLVEEATEREDVQRHDSRFVVATDFETIVARDLKTGDSLDVPLAELPRRYDWISSARPAANSSVATDRRILETPDASSRRWTVCVACGGRPDRWWLGTFHGLVPSTSIATWKSMSSASTGGPPRTGACSSTGCWSKR